MADEGHDSEHPAAPRSCVVSYAVAAATTAAADAAAAADADAAADDDDTGI